MAVIATIAPTLFRLPLATANLSMTTQLSLFPTVSGFQA